MKLTFALLGAAMSGVLALAMTGVVYLSAGANPELRRMEERVLMAPGAVLARRFDQSATRRRIEEDLKKLPGEKTEAKLAEKVEAAVDEKLEGSSHLYNVGAWTLGAFVLCLTMTLLLGVSSLLDAVALGFKVMFTLAGAQVALILYMMARGGKLP